MSAVAGVALPAALAHAGVRAEQVTAENAPLLLPGGPDAVGGVGDWALSNGTLCAVVADQLSGRAARQRGKIELFDRVERHRRSAGRRLPRGTGG